MLTMELVLMMLPPPCSFMIGATARQPLNTAVTFTSMMCSKSSGLYCSSGSRAEMPALLTRMSMRPNFSLTAAIVASTAA